MKKGQGEPKDVSALAYERKTITENFCKGRQEIFQALFKKTNKRSFFARLASLR
jgi:hypothetical protein